MSSASAQQTDLTFVAELARATAKLGDTVGLPYVGASADIGSTLRLRGALLGRTLLVRGRTVRGVAVDPAARPK